MKHAITTGAGLAALMLGGCAGINDAIAPPLRADPESGDDRRIAARVSMPLPTSTVETQKPNSPWRYGRSFFFNDQRANKIGDILTVNIEIADSAQLNNTTARSRTSSTGTSVDALLGAGTLICEHLARLRCRRA